MTGEKAHLESLSLGNVKTVRDDARVQAFGNVSICLLQELAHKEDNRGRTIAADVVLCRRGSCNHHCSRVLNLHLAEENVAVLGELDLFRDIRQLGVGG